MTKMPRMRADQCTATNRRTGQRCKRWANLGTTVCTVHGSRLPTVVAAAARERTMWEVGQRAEREGRHPMEVLRTVLHVRDHLLGKLLAQVADRDDVTPGEIRELDDRLTQAQRAAEVAVRSGVQLWFTQRSQVEAETVVRALNQALGAVDLTPDQESAMRTALAQALREIGEQDRTAALAITAG